MRRRVRHCVVDRATTQRWFSPEQGPARIAHRYLLQVTVGWLLLQKRVEVFGERGRIRSMDLCPPWLYNAFEFLQYMLGYRTFPIRCAIVCGLMEVRWADNLEPWQEEQVMDIVVEELGAAIVDGYFPRHWVPPGVLKGEPNQEAG